MQHVIIYTDGGASPNPGLGGWGAVLISEQHNFTREISGAEPDTTNNRMELTAAIKALESLKFSCEVDLYTDSGYLSNAFNNGWLDKWQKNNWNKGKVLNIDLWQKLLNLTQIHKINWHWIKGHGNNKFNNRCDELVNEARENYKLNS